MSGRTQGRLDDLDIRAHQNTSNIATLMVDLQEANDQIEALKERVDYLEAEATIDYGFKIRNLAEAIQDVEQYLMRRDGVPHMGRYAKTHDELIEKVI